MGEDPEAWYIGACAGSITMIHSGDTSKKVGEKQHQCWSRLVAYSYTPHLRIRSDKSKCVWVLKKVGNALLRGVRPETKRASYNGHGFRTLYHDITTSPPFLAPAIYVPVVKMIRVLGVMFATGTFKEHVYPAMRRLKRRGRILQRRTS